MRKKRYERRKAIDCKLLEKSKKNPGYCKYEVTIQEKNGYIHKEPAYGKDMQDAISRLIWNERTRIIEKKLGAGWFFLAWLAIMGWPAIMLERTDKSYLYTICVCWGNNFTKLLVFFGGDTSIKNKNN